MWRNLPPEVRDFAAERQRLPPGIEREKKIITRAQVPIKDVDHALSQYYDDTIAAAVKESPMSEGELRRWFSRSLITAGERRIVLAEDESTKRSPRLLSKSSDSSGSSAPSSEAAPCGTSSATIASSNRSRHQIESGSTNGAQDEALRQRLEYKAVVWGARLDEVELREAEGFLRRRAPRCSAPRIISKS